MKDQGIVGIKGVDTHSLVRTLRDHGSIAAGIFSGADADRPVEELLEVVRSQKPMPGSALSQEVSTDDIYELEPTGEDQGLSVAVFDMGLKANTPGCCASVGCAPSSSRRVPPSMS